MTNNPTIVHKVHIMLDVETTGLTPETGAIWQLGAVAVIQHTEKDSGKPAGASLVRADKYGFEYTLNPWTVTSYLLNEKTIVWQQCNNSVNWEAAEKSNNTYQHFLSAGLLEFHQWLWKMEQHSTFGEIEAYWAQGSDFDFGFLRSAYAEARLSPMWEYHQIRDLRTLRKVLPLPELVKTNPHNALADATWQAESLAHIFNYLTEKGIHRG